MADFDIVNLDDVPDMAPKFDLGHVQEARFAGAALHATQLGISEVRMKPDQRAPFGHSHEHQEELYLVTAGTGRVLLGGTVRELMAGDVLRVDPGVERAFESGPDGVTIVAFGAPAVSDGENDAQMAKPVWPDALA